MGSILALQTTGDTDVTMSSREIADLTDKRHDNVIRVCRDLKASGITPQIEECRVINELANGREFTEFRLSKRDSHILVARLSPEFTGRLVDRWMELEAAAPAPVPAPAELSRMQILEMAMQSERERLALTEQLAAAAPAVEFVQRYADSTGTKGFRQVCKLLGANESQFREFLIEEKIMYRLGGELTPHAPHIDAGRFCVKTGTAQVSGHAYNAARFTPKGVTWVAGEWAKWQLKQREKWESVHA
jgi:phage antirepressor YoqD-like protein